MKKSPERYFYHSFPQPADKPNEDWIKNEECHKNGISVLNSINSIGLLLTPEQWEIPAEPVASPPIPSPLPVFQKRVCFTEISPFELQKHAAYFGPFSLEFELGVLRRMGALPVFYVPGSYYSGRDYSGLGISLMYRLGELHNLLERLQNCYSAAKTLPPNQTIILKRNDSNENSPINCTADAMVNFFQLIEQGNRDIWSLQESLRMIFNL